MKISNKGIELICLFEGLKLKPYLDSVNIPTIGYGTTVYPNGVKVTMQDAAITEIQAKQFLQHHVSLKCYPSLEGLELNQNQFDALCSLIYNIGAGGFKSSTVKRLILSNPNDPAITAAFAMWNKAGGKVLEGLTRRRRKEAEYYFQ
jgi:lysozyme